MFQSQRGSDATSDGFVHCISTHTQVVLLCRKSFFLQEDLYLLEILNISE
ncbi:DUF952 domain-containing protein [Priestia megaterium]